MADVSCLYLRTGPHLVSPHATLPGPSVGDSGGRLSSDRVQQASGDSFHAIPFVAAGVSRLPNGSLPDATTARAGLISAGWMDNRTNTWGLYVRCLRF
jgi:hypothetical protein